MLSYLRQLSWPFFVRNIATAEMSMFREKCACLLHPVQPG